MLSFFLVPTTVMIVSFDFKLLKMGIMSSSTLVNPSHSGIVVFTGFLRKNYSKNKQIN